ncbi:unnamed protein product, partial [Sphagnum compactum]
MSSAKSALQEIDTDGKFVRTQSLLREKISPNHPVYQPENDRYHLYIALACPWANRCYAVLKLKGLESCIGVSITHPTWQRTRPNDPDDSHCGWVFNTGVVASPSGYGKFSNSNCTPDKVNNVASIRDLYEMCTDQKAKFTVPVLWDKKTSTIVNNESSEILRMLTQEFDVFATGPYANLDLYPSHLRSAIDAENDWIYHDINDGVYKCGFAQTQESYDAAVNSLFTSLDRLESMLSKHRYVVGDTLTEADIRLFMTLVRFDEVYVVYFKCNKKRIMDYPNIRQYVRDIYQVPGVGDSIDIAAIKTHYYTSHPRLNYFAIIPRGPDAVSDFVLPHDRDR